MDITIICVCIGELKYTSVLSCIHTICRMCSLATECVLLLQNVSVLTCIHTICTCTSMCVCVRARTCVRVYMKLHALASFHTETTYIYNFMNMSMCKCVCARMYRMCSLATECVLLLQNASVCARTCM